MSSGIVDTGKPQRQRIAMACSDGSVWGVAGIVDQSSFLTAGKRDSNSEKSAASCRAAVTMMVQKSSGEES